MIYVQSDSSLFALITGVPFSFPIQCPLSFKKTAIEEGKHGAVDDETRAFDWSKQGFVFQ